MMQLIHFHHMYCEVIKNSIGCPRRAALNKGAREWLKEKGCLQFSYYWINQ